MRSADKAAGDAVAAVVVVPVRPGTAGARATIAAMHDAARRRGLIRARVHGFAGGVSAHAGDAVHAAAGAAAALLTHVSPTAAVALLGVLALSAGARCAGWPGLGEGVAKVPCWNLVLRRPATITTLVILPLDRARPVAWAPWAVFAGLAVALVASGFASGVVGSALLMPLALVAWRAGRGPAEGDEAADAMMLVQLATELPADAPVAVVISGAAALGDGARAFLDWWALSPASTRVIVLGHTPAAEILAAEGWRVVAPADAVALRSLLAEGT